MSQQSVAGTPRIPADVEEILTAWRRGLSLAELMKTRWSAPESAGPYDVLAIGKAAPAMRVALDEIGCAVRRELVITTPEARRPGSSDLIGEHPVAGEASQLAGHSLGQFLDEGQSDVPTIVLLSGGASALAVDLAEPLGLAELYELWEAALRSGLDITTLNHLRASVSYLGGGMLARRIRSSESVVMVMVDNVVSGAEWVGSGPFTDYSPGPEELEELMERVGMDAQLRERWRRAAASRSVRARHRARTHVQRVIVAEPGDVTALVGAEARRRGYDVVDLGAELTTDVVETAERFCSLLSEAKGPRVVLGAGELTVRVLGDGRGGRCQEFAARAALGLSRYGLKGAVVAGSATDGHDHLEGVAGAWADSNTLDRAGERGLSVEEFLSRSDAGTLMERLGQTLEGGATGWNLCDVYLGLVRPQLDDESS